MADPTPGAVEAIQAVAASVTGPDTPASAKVTTRPERSLVWALILAGPVVTFFLAIIIWIVGLAPWPFSAWGAAQGLDPWPAAVADWRIKALAAIGLAEACTLAVIVFRIGGGALRKVSASAGPASLNIETEDE